MIHQPLPNADYPGPFELEFWAGAECTVNRVGEVYRDQVKLTGHHDRFEDLDLLAGLGIAALRFPVLWERVSPDDPEQRDWDWTDRRLDHLRRLNIRPIAGLVHHGSGPRYTSLIDDSFAPGLARHALAVAERYPWVQDWTPVNEPLTTARFSALYGLWYPHARDEGLFWTALINQVDAVRQSMRAIRGVNPEARLIQTDDLGRTYSTAAMADQAGFDNVRRWATWDLLSGRVGPDHDLWERLCSFGIEGKLRSLLDDPCPPDVIGINHYLTSDRFLDHRLQRYPRHTHGGNGRQAYADVEAVRVLEPPTAGLEGAIGEAWERYRLPIAVTEVHVGCTREDQVRWLREAYRLALKLRLEGVDVQAVTAWATFGSQGWNTLLTDTGLYEAGLFDARGEQPRATALAKSLKSLRDHDSSQPNTDQAGWWSRNIRLHHPTVNRPAPLREGRLAVGPDGAPPPPILILGATGTLGRAVAAACEHRNLPYKLIGRSELDLADGASIEPALDRFQPWAVINAAGWVRVDDAESEAESCMKANAGGATALARSCHARRIPTVSFSSDLVFGGADAPAYRESDAPAPLNVYGESKWRMERDILALDGEHLIIRTAAFFSPHDEFNFARNLVRTLREARVFEAAGDCIVTPTYVPDLCDAVLDLLIDGERGIWHLSNHEPVSWADFASRVAQACRLDESLVRPVPSATFGWDAARPRSSALFSEKGSPMPSLGSAIERFADAMV
ncbi:MAG: family 1 glycosylhydrolase [Novosphingobium sp.]